MTKHFIIKTNNIRSMIFLPRKFIFLAIIIASLSALLGSSLSFAYVQPVAPQIINGAVSEIRYGPWQSAKIWIRIPDSLTGCNAPLAGNPNVEGPDFISIPINDNTSKYFLTLFSMAKALNQNVKVQYNTTVGGECEVLFVELK